MTEERWVVVHIGCIECGCASGIVGIFSDEKTAERIAEECNEKHSWMGGGQNSFEVFPAPVVNTVHEDYEGVSL